MDFNAPVEDSEVAGKDNFKSNSKWEGLASKFEEVFLRTLSNKKLPIGKSPSITEEQPWNEVGETFEFGQRQLTLTRYWISGVSSASPEKDFDLEVVSSKRREEGSNNEQIETPKVWLCPRGSSKSFFNTISDLFDYIPCFHSCYGLEDFIVLSVRYGSRDCEKTKKFFRILSEVIGSHCQVPLFVHVNSPNYSIGIMECSGIKTSFEVIHQIHDYSDHNCYVDFMMCMTKLGIEVIPNTTKLSARFTYIIYEISCYPCEALPSDLTFSATDFGMKESCHLKDEYDSSEFKLCLNWPNYEITTFDLDLDLNTAPEWLLRAKFPDTSEVPLGECLRRFLDMSYPSTSPCFQTTVIEEYVKEIDESLNSMKQYFGSKFRNDIFKLGSIYKDSPILPESLDPILVFLFSHSSQHCCVENSASTAGEVYDFFSFPSKEVSKYFVSAKDSDLMTRLAVCLCIVNKYHGGIVAVNQLWEEFILQVQYYNDVPFVKKYRRNMGCLLPPWNLQILRLSMMEPSDLVFAFMPFLIQSAVTTLKNYSECKNSFLKEHLLRIEEKLKDIQCDKSEFKKYEDLVHYVTLIEQKLKTIQYILERLRPYVLTLSDTQRISEEELQNFVSDLVENRMVLIKNHKENPFGMLIHNFFLENLEPDYSDDKTSWNQKPRGCEFKYSKGAYDDPDAETSSIQEACVRAVSEPISECDTHVLDEKVTWGQLDKFPKPWGREYTYTLKSKPTDPSHQPYTQLFHCFHLGKYSRAVAAAFTPFGEGYEPVMYCY